MSLPSGIANMLQVATQNDLPLSGRADSPILVASIQRIAHWVGSSWELRELEESESIVGNLVVGGSLQVSGSVQADSVLSSAGAGTPATGVTAVEYGDGRNHQTVLTIASVLPAIAGGAELGVGKLLYTLPAGAHIIESAYMDVSITQSEGNITADTPEVGLGTVIASGAVAVLSGTATFEDILTGQVAADCDGTATVKTALPTAGAPLIIEAAGAKTIHFNVADDWAADGDAAAVISGTVVINWRTMA